MQNTYKLMRLSLFILISVFVLSETTYAHSKIQAFILINGVEANLTNSLKLPLPQPEILIHDTDYASEVYGVGQTLKFDLIRDRIRVIPGYVDSSDYFWDFGDGSPKERVKAGLSMDHTYKNPGEYLVKIDVVYPAYVKDISGPVYIESVYVEIKDTSKSSGSSTGVLIIIGALVIFVGIKYLGTRVYTPKLS